MHAIGKNTRCTTPTRFLLLPKEGHAYGGRPRFCGNLGFRLFPDTDSAPLLLLGYLIYELGEIAYIAVRLQKLFAEVELICCTKQHATTTASPPTPPHTTARISPSDETVLLDEAVDVGHIGLRHLEINLAANHGVGSQRAESTVLCVIFLLHMYVPRELSKTYIYMR